MASYLRLAAVRVTITLIWHYAHCPKELMLEELGVFMTEVLPELDAHGFGRQLETGLRSQAGRGKNHSGPGPAGRESHDTHQLRTLSAQLDALPRLSERPRPTPYARAVHGPTNKALGLHPRLLGRPRGPLNTTPNSPSGLMRPALTLIFALATWLGKGGYGGDIHFREHSIDPFITSAALAPLTHNVLLISTIHVLYGWHPLHIAKYGAVIDHISHGRWGLNVVTGYRPDEAGMFGRASFPHNQRYVMADEFTTVMKRLWTEDKNLDYAGEWYKTAGAFVAPKPVNGLPVLVSAGSSPAGMDYATSHADIIFATSPTGADPDKACASLPQRILPIKAQARKKGREVKILVNPHVICRPTEKEAQAWYKRIRDERDEVGSRKTSSTPSGAGTSLRGVSIARSNGQWAAISILWGHRK